MSIVEVTFPSYTLRRSVTFKALIPNEGGYTPGKAGEFSKEKRKTLYLLHGYTGDCNDYIMNSNISFLAGINNLAVIFPSGENSFYLEDIDKGEDFSRFIGEELVAYTRSLFRLSEDREDTYIGGFSMGGYGAMINGLRYPETFSKIISLSGAYIALNIADAGVYLPDGVSDEKYQRRIFGEAEQLRNSNKDPRFCLENLKAAGTQIPDIYLVCGAEDFLIESNRKLHRFLIEQEIAHLYKEGEGVHNWVYWNKHLELSVQWLLGKEESEQDKSEQDK